VSYTNENEFDNLFQETPPEPTMSEERVRAIARDQHFKDLAGLQQATFALDQRRQAALQRAEKQHPGFEKLYGDAQATNRFKKENPAHSRWIWAAESGMGTEADIDELYDGFYTAASQYKPEEPRQHSPAKQTPTSAFTLEAINHLPSELRRPHIEALKEKVGDASLDVADLENDRYRLERGEG